MGLSYLDQSHGHQAALESLAIPAAEDRQDSDPMGKGGATGKRKANDGKCNLCGGDVHYALPHPGRVCRPPIAIAAMVEGTSNLHVRQPAHTLMAGAHATTAKAAGAKVAELTPGAKVAAKRWKNKKGKQGETEDKAGTR